MSHLLRTMGFSLVKVGRGLNQIRKINVEASCRSYSQLLSEKPDEQPSIAEPQPLKVDIDPLKHPDYFGVRNLFTVQDLFDAKVHLGHRTGSLDDAMKRFIFGKRLDHLIVDLDQTAHLLREALNFTAHIAYREGIVLFVSRSPQITVRVERAAQECGEYACARPWRRGTLTNVMGLFKHEIRLPDLVIFLNTLGTTYEQHDAIPECAKMLIPTVGVVDTNCNPNLITYPVPGNDDTPSAVELYLKLFKEAILLGKAKHKESLVAETKSSTEQP